MWGFNPKTIIFNHTYIMSKLPRELVISGRVKSTDSWYNVPINPGYVMKKVPSWKHLYESDKFDCDDFVRVFRGWLSKKGYGNLLAMEAEVTLGNGIGHNLIAFMDMTRTDKFEKHPLIFGEPQTGKVIDIFESNKFSDIRLRL